MIEYRVPHPGGMFKKLKTSDKFPMILTAQVLLVATQGHMPRFSWNTLPVAFHSSNCSGMYTDEELRIIAKFSCVTIEKWQSVHELVAPSYNWESCVTSIKPSGQNVTLCGCCEEDRVVNIGRAIKAIDPSTMVCAQELDKSSRIFCLFSCSSSLT